MKELWFVPIIGILGVISTILSSKGSLYDKRFKWHNRLTLRGKIVTLIGLSIVGLSIWQYVTTKNKDDQKETLQIRQRQISDSLISSGIKKGVDSNRQVLFKDLSEALAKQNLKLDTVTKSIEALRDSAKTVIVNSPKVNPIIIIRSNGVSSLQKNDTTIEFTLNLVPRQAACIIKYINYLCELNYVDGSKARTNLNNLILGKLLIPVDEGFSKKFEIDIFKDLKFINIALAGKYTREDGSGEFKFEEVYQYSLLTKSLIFLPAVDKDIFFALYKIRTK